MDGWPCTGRIAIILVFQIQRKILPDFEISAIEALIENGKVIISKKTEKPSLELKSGGL